MEYNTKREYLTIPEYGRNIQKMIEYCVAIEDKEKRNQTAHAIVKVMDQMNNQSSKANDYYHRLWDHLFIISDFKLDIDSPYPMPDKDEVSKKPDKIEYSVKNMSFPHYGKNIERVIDAIADTEEGEQKDALTFAIANYLKKSYLNWNRESVNDETILKNLEELSGGRIKLNDDFELISTSEALMKQRKQRNIVNKKTVGFKGMKKRKRK